MVVVIRFLYRTTVLWHDEETLLSHVQAGKRSSFLASVLQAGLPKNHLEGGAPPVGGQVHGVGLSHYSTGRISGSMLPKVSHRYSGA